MAPPRRRRGQYHPGVRYENRREAPVYTISALRAEQISRPLLALKPALAALPLEELVAHPETAELIASAGVEAAVTLPRVFWDRELPEMELRLEQLRNLGVETACAAPWPGPAGPAPGVPLPGRFRP